MTSDDSQFLDTLASYSASISRTVIEFPYVGVINDGIDQASHKLRDTLDSATWLPDFARPQPPPPPPRTYIFPSSHGGVVSACADWIVRHRIAVTTATAFFGTGALLYLRRRRLYARKRRAKRSKTGARCEVVVVAGSPSTPVARSVILELERRGYIVYVVTENSADDEDVKSENKADILPLHLDITDPLDVETTVSQFRQFLRTPQRATAGGEPHDLSFAGLILIPDLNYTSGPVETISTELWSDELNSKVLRTIAITQAFLSTLSGFRSRAIFMSPSIVSNMQLPFQSVESTMVNALNGFSTSLRSEAATIGVDICQIRLGHFDVGPVSSRGALAIDAGQEVLTWPASARSAYAQNYLAGKSVFHKKPQVPHALGNSRRNRGSNLRELNNAIFDTLSRSRPWSVQRVGQGSLAYEVIGKLTPSMLVRKMMGIKSVDLAGRQRRVSESGSWETVNYEK